MNLAGLQTRHGLDAPHHRPIARRSLNQPQGEPQGRRRIRRRRGIDFMQGMGRQPAQMPIRLRVPQVEASAVGRTTVRLHRL